MLRFKEAVALGDWQPLVLWKLEPGGRMKWGGGRSALYRAACPRVTRCRKGKAEQLRCCASSSLAEVEVNSLRAAVESFPLGWGLLTLAPGRVLVAFS